jgi:hypothetical protein
MIIRSTLGRLSLGLAIFMGSTLTAMADGGTQEFKLLPGTGSFGAMFGSCVAISGSMVVVGAPLDDDNGYASGAAYLFNAGTGQFVFKLLPSDGLTLARFGSSVAISGTTVVIGAPTDDVNGSASGSAYVFDATTGQQLDKLVPNDAAAGDLFGISIAIAGSVAVIGAERDDDKGVDSGSVYLFDVTTGLQSNKLLASDGAAIDLFGHSVAISASIIVVGVFGDDDNGVDSGSALVFDASTGAELFKLLPSDGAAGDQFGFSVAVDGSDALVGAFQADDNGGESGSAYLFDANTGQMDLELLPSDGVAGDYFGFSVALSGGLALVGSMHDGDLGPESGSAYLFETAVGLQLGKLVPSDGDQFDNFGSSIALEGTTAILGAEADEDAGLLAGSAYLFDVTSVQASVVARNGTGLNASILTSLTNPVLGTSWEIDLNCRGHAASLAALLVHEQPFGGFLLAGGELLVDVSSPQIVVLAMPHNGDTVRFSLAIPNDSMLCGLQAFAQGVVLGAPGYELSNALDAVGGR